MKSKKVALIGCGRIAGHHCRSIKMIPGMEIAAVCDLIESKAKDYGDEFDVPYYTNYHKMLTEISDIDIVSIVTPSGMHYEHALDILRRYEKDIVVEKPTFLKFSQLDEVFKVAKGLGKHVFPVFQLSRDSNA